MNLLRFRRAPKPDTMIERVGMSDAATISIVRGRKVEESMRIGPNQVHAVIFHDDGGYTNLGIGHNLLTNSGRDLVAAGLGHAPGSQGAFTATTATSGTGTGFTADQYKGWRVYSVTGLTTPPVYGNIGSNTTTVLTLDQWWNATDGTAATPSSINGYIILPSVLPRFMALTENASAASAANTALTGEITTGGANRQLATYAHTGGTATLTLQKTYTITASFPAIHRMGLFTASTLTAAGIMVFESVLSADANVISGDSLQVTDTLSLS